MPGDRAQVVSASKRFRGLSTTAAVCHSTNERSFAISSSVEAPARCWESPSATAGAAQATLTKRANDVFIRSRHVATGSLESPQMRSAGSSFVKASVSSIGHPASAAICRRLYTSAALYANAD